MFVEDLDLRFDLLLLLLLLYSLRSLVEPGLVSLIHFEVQLILSPHPFVVLRTVLELNPFQINQIHINDIHLKIVLPQRNMDYLKPYA